MKKNILLGVLLLILLFSYSTKLKRKKNNKTINKENAILITVVNGRKFDSNEEKTTKITDVFDKKNSIQNPFNISKNKNTIKHSSRNNKGKIMFSNDHYIISETQLD